MATDSVNATESVQNILPGIGDNFTVDESVLTCLPNGTLITGATTWGTSAWTKTAKVTAVLPDGSHKSYFMKCATFRGAIMMEGEYNSLIALYSLNPSFVPRPYGWGKFKSSDTYFLLMDFLDLKIVLPDPVKFCDRLTDIHQRSKSPTGMFGFMVPNCHGKIIQPNDWDPSWSSYFTKLISMFFEEEIKTNGPWREYQGAFEVLRSRVIPSILEPLQAEGRILKPCLVHGDLWEENTGINVETGEPTVFDASAMYAHNEYELGMWRREIIRFNQSYFKQYRSRVPASAPVKQWDDRNRLYSIKFNLAHCIGWPGSTNTREQIYEDICFLNNKYASA